MKTKSPLFIFSILLLALGIIIDSSIFMYQKYFNAETMRLSDKNILPTFSGKFLQMAGMGSALLTLYTDFTFTYLLHTDLGPEYDVTYTGTVVIMKGQIHLLASDADGEIFVPKYLLPVRWGTQKYLVEPDHISYFCEAITSDQPESLGYLNILQRPWGKFPSYQPNDAILPNSKPICY